jgi:hypothetical protein
MTEYQYWLPSSFISVPQARQRVDYAIGGQPSSPSPKALIAQLSTICINWVKMVLPGPVFAVKFLGLFQGVYFSYRSRKPLRAIKSSELTECSIGEPRWMP